MPAVYGPNEQQKTKQPKSQWRQINQNEPDETEEWMRRVFKIGEAKKVHTLPGSGLESGKSATFPNSRPGPISPWPISFTTILIEIFRTPFAPAALHLCASA